MDLVAEQYKDAKTIHIVWDKLNIHYDGKSERWRKFNAAHDGKFVFHYTPLHASWVNQVEIFFSILQRKVVRHGSFTSAQDLTDRILAFVNRWNGGEGHPFTWTCRSYPLEKEAGEVVASHLSSPKTPCTRRAFRTRCSPRPTAA